MFGRVMADFNVQTIEPQGAGANPLPVAQPAKVDNSILTGMLDNVASVFSRGLQESAKEKAAKLAATVVGRYTREQDALNQALESSQIKPHEHAARSRTLYSSMLAQYPEFVEDLNKANTGFRSGTGVGYSSDEVKDDRQARRNRIAQAEKDGVYFPPGVDEVTIDAGLKLHAEMVAGRQQMDDIYKRNSENRSQTDWERRNLQEETKVKSSQIITSIASTQLDFIQKSAVSLANQVLANPASAPQAQQALGFQLAQVKAAIQAAAGTNPELASGYKEIFDQVAIVSQKMLDPKADVENLKAQFEAIKYRGMLAAAGDPEVRGAIATTALFPNTAAANVAATRAAVSAFALASTVDMNGPNASTVPQIIGSKEEKYVLEGAKKALADVASGNVPDKEIAEKQASNLLNTLLIQTGEYAERFNVDPTKLVGIVDLVSSPSFLKMVESGKVNRASLEVAKRAIELNWEKAVVKRLQGELDKTVYQAAYRKGGEKAPAPISMKDAITVEFAGSGVRILPKKMIGLDPVEQASIAESLRDMKPIENTVNVMLRAITHMGGNADYAQTWEKTKGLIFPDMFKEEPKKAEGPKPKRSAAEEKMAKEVSNIDPKAPDRVYEDAVNGVMKEWERLTPEQRESFRQSIIQMWSK